MSVTTRLFSGLLLLFVYGPVFCSQQCDYDVRHLGEDKFLIKRHYVNTLLTKKATLRIGDAEVDVMKVPTKHYMELTADVSQLGVNHLLTERDKGLITHACNIKLNSNSYVMESFKQLISFFVGATVALMSGFLMNRAHFNRKKKYYKKLFVALIDDIISRWDYVEVENLNLNGILEDPHPVLAEYFLSRVDEQFTKDVLICLDSIMLARSNKTNEQKQILANFVSTYQVML